VRVVGVRWREDAFANQPAYIRLPPLPLYIWLAVLVGWIHAVGSSSVNDNLPHPSLHDDQINTPSLKKCH
jgi:hypothetical protein